MKAFSFFAPRYAALRLTLLAMLFSLWGGTAWGQCPTGPYTLIADKNPAAYCDGDAIQLEVDVASYPTGLWQLDLYNGSTFVTTLTNITSFPQTFNLTASASPASTFNYSVQITDLNTPQYCGVTNTVVLITGDIQAGSYTTGTFGVCNGGITLNNYYTLCPDGFGATETIRIDLYDSTPAYVATQFQTPPSTTTNFTGLCADTYSIIITDPCGCSLPVNGIVVPRLGFTKNDAVLSAFVYPNPARNLITVKYDTQQDARYRITSSDGRILTEGYLHKNLKEYMIPLASPVAGAYSLQILENGQVKAVRSFVVTP